MKDIKTYEVTTIFEALMQSRYIAYVIVDKAGIITAVNQTYLNLLERKLEDVIGRYILDVVPTSKLPEVLKTGKMDTVGLWKINGRDTIVCRMPTIKDGEVVGGIAQSLFLDVAGEKIFMKKLQEKEKELTAVSEALVQSPHMVYVIVNEKGIITFINQTYLDLLAMRKEDVVGKHVLEITPHSQLPEVLRTGKVHEVDTWTINGRDTIITRTPIIKDGKITGAVGRSIFMDMSGAKMLVMKLLQTEKELNIYKEEVRHIYQAKWQFKDLIGKSTEFVMVKSMAQQLSNTTSTILITGESGTGKELFAQAIHHASRRESGPFVRINCVSLPENLLESELFGYEEGAFTGARKGGKPGKFELAKGGTILLDEIGDMPLTMQTKLLSVLQERVIERVGGINPINIDVRVIAATNRDLEQMVRNGEFREDLYYRLNVVRVSIPPLRKRISDLPLLVKDLMVKINNKLKTSVTQCSEKAIEVLQSYSWPGNVRELENLLERAINLADMNNETCLTEEHFPSLFKGVSKQEPNYGESNLARAVEKLETETIERILQQCDYNKTQAAKILGINKSVLYRKLKKYNLVSFQE